MGQTSSYIYFNNAGTFGLINTIDSSLNWYITLSGNATIPTINSVTGNITTLNSTTGNITTLNSTTGNITTLNSTTGNITTLNSTTGTITNLYSNILAINNNNVRRSNNDILEVATSSTGNYLYYNSASVFGHINTSNSALNWYINSSGLASLPNLAINSPNIRGSGDLLNVSVTPTGNYIYLNNGGVLGGYNASGNSI